MGFVQFDKRRLACVNSIFHKKSFIDSFKQLKEGISSAPNFKSINGIASKGLLLLQKQLDLSINLICNLINTDREVRVFTHRNHQNHHEQSYLQGLQMIIIENELKTTLQSTVKLSRSLIDHIQEYFETNDMNIITHFIQSGDLGEFNDLITSLHQVHQVKYYCNPKNFDLDYFFFTDDMTRIKIIGSSSLFFHQLDELVNDVMTSKPIILLKDSNNIDELANFIYEFHSFELKSMVFLNIKYKSSIYIYFNFVIDNTTRLWDKSKIKSILANMISICEKDKGRYSWLQ